MVKMVGRQIRGLGWVIARLVGNVRFVGSCRLVVPGR